MDEDPRIALQPYLIGNEVLRWTGRPRSGLAFTSSDVVLIPFSLLWGGFVIFWEASVIRDGAGWFFVLWGVPFVIIGLFMIFGRFAVDAWARSRTLYGLTDRRALILRRIPGGGLTAVDLAAAPDVRVSIRSDGSGDVSLAPAKPLWRRRRDAGWAMWMPSIDGTLFFGIPDAQAVYQRIEKARAAARAQTDRI